MWTAWLDRLTSQEGPIKLQLHQIREPGLFTQWDYKPPGHYKRTLICGKGRSCFQPGPDEAKGFSTMSPPLLTPPACNILYGQQMELYTSIHKTIRHKPIAWRKLGKRDTGDLMGMRTHALQVSEHHSIPGTSWFPKHCRERAWVSLSSTVSWELCTESQLSWPEL